MRGFPISKGSLKTCSLPKKRSFLTSQRGLASSSVPPAAPWSPSDPLVGSVHAPSCEPCPPSPRAPGCWQRAGGAPEPCRDAGPSHGVITRGHHELGHPPGHPPALLTCLLPSSLLFYLTPTAPAPPALISWNWTVVLATQPWDCKSHGTAHFRTVDFLPVETWNSSLFWTVGHLQY